MQALRGLFVIKAEVGMPNRLGDSLQGAVEW